MNNRSTKFVFNLESLLFLVVTILFLLSKVVQTDLNQFLFGFLLLVYIILLFNNIKNILRLQKYYFFLFLYILILTVYGVVNNNFISYILVDIFSFFSFLFIFMTYKTANREIFFFNFFPKLGVYINLFSILFVFYSISINGLNFASIAFGRGLDDIGGNPLMSPKYLLYGSLFLYPMIGYLKSKMSRFIYNFAIFLFFIFSIAMASRGTVIISLIIIILTNLSEKGLRFRLKTFISKKFISYIFIFISTVILLYQIPKIESATDYLIYRFTEESTGEERSLEASEIYDNLSTSEFIFGKGIGAANSYWIFSQTPNGVNNTHFGWMFLILKGGVLFLLFVYGKIILSIIKLYRHVCIVLLYLK